MSVFVCMAKSESEYCINTNTITIYYLSKTLTHTYTNIPLQRTHLNISCLLFFCFVYKILTGDSLLKCCIQLERQKKAKLIFYRMTTKG